MSNMCSSKQFKSTKKKKQFRELYGPLIRTEMEAKGWLRHIVKESGHPSFPQELSTAEAHLPGASIACKVDS